MPKFQKKTPPATPTPLDTAIPADISVQASPELTAPEPVTDPDTKVSADTLVEVWERRFLDPNQRGSNEVKLKAQGMICRWINTTIEGRYHRAVYDQGWQPVPVSLLADPSSIPDLYKHPHNIVARGERGKEVLMMMPEQVFEKIRRRKAALNLAATRKIRAELAEAAAGKFGPEAGDFVHSGQTADGLIKTVGSINFGAERIPMGSE
jgi:hypothetical protein